MKKIIITLVTLIVFSVGLWSYIEDNNKKVEDLGVPEDNKLLEHFVSLYPDNKVLKCGYEDINNDGIKDLVVIYNESTRKNAMVVIIDKGDGYQITKSMPAPLENQTIEFKNIDEKDEIEFIISGSKDGRFGYAIYRLQGLEIKDLFGEGMEDCC